MFSKAGCTGKRHHTAKSETDGLVIRLVKLAWCQTLFCQESLTKNLFWVENKDNYLSSLKMKFGKLGSGLAGLGMLITATGAEAQEIKLASAEGLNNPVIAKIVKSYQECVKENITASDWDADGKISGGDEAEFLNDLNKSCDKSLNIQVDIAQLDKNIASSRQKSAEAKKRSADITARLIAGAKKDLGLQ